MSVALVATAVAAVEATVAQPAQAGTCGDYVRLYQAPPFGPVTDDWIGTDAHTGEVIDISRSEAAHYVAAFGDNLKPFTNVLYVFYPLNGRNLTPRTLTARVDYNGVLRDDSFRVDIRQLSSETTLWEVWVDWMACGGAYDQVIGYLQTSP